VIRAGEAVRNFDQLKVGDRVTYAQGEALLVSLTRVSGGIRQRSDWVEVHVAQPGEKPGILVRHRVHAVANVTAIDRKAGMVTLRGVHETHKFKIDDKQLLASLKVGDQVEATLVRGEAAFVEPAKAH
jgi:Cu/Ag efflux protein CusF